MPCEPIAHGGKIVGWSCRHSRGRPKPPPCYKCGRPSTCLCDHRAMEAHYSTDDYGHKLKKIWVPDLNTCDRPMCADCATHIDPDTDYCEFHSDEIAITRSTKAETLFQEQLRRLGIEEEP